MPSSTSHSLKKNTTQREKDLSDGDEKKPKARTAIVPIHVPEEKTVPIDAVVEVVKPPPASVTSKYNHFNWIMTHCEIPTFGFNSITDSWKNTDMEYVHPHPLLFRQNQICQHVLMACKDRYKHIMLSELKSMLDDINGARSVDSRELWPLKRKLNK